MITLLVFAAQLAAATPEEAVAVLRRDHLESDFTDRHLILPADAHGPLVAIAPCGECNANHQAAYRVPAGHSWGVVVSPFGRGNLKIGSGVYTYSRLPGHPSRPALGTAPELYLEQRGTCPGSSPECEAICYASRPMEERGAVAAMCGGPTP